MEEAIPLVEHCKNFLRDNAHQIRAASAARVVPRANILAVLSRAEGLVLIIILRVFFGFERFFFRFFGFGENFGRFFGF